MKKNNKEIAKETNNQLDKEQEINPKNTPIISSNDSDILELYKMLENSKPFFPIIPILKYFSQPNFKMDTQMEFWKSYLDLVSLYPMMIQKYWLEELEKANNKNNFDDNKPS